MTLHFVRSIVPVLSTMRQSMNNFTDSVLHLETNSTPKFSGPVIVQHNTTFTGSGPNSPARLRMVAKVYESHFGHYVLFHRDNRYDNQSVYINLKHCSVQRVDTDEPMLRIVSQNCDAMSITVGLSCENVLQKWLQVLAPKEGLTTMLGSSKTSPIPRSSLLPTLEESEEE